MKTFTKLLLTTAILATGASSSTPNGDLTEGAVINTGTEILVPANTVVETNVNTSYTANKGIDVMIGTNGGGEHGGLKGVTGDTASSSTASQGTLKALVVRHWEGSGQNWSETTTGSNAYVVTTGLYGDHGFVSNGLTIDGTNGHLTELPEQNGNALARCYRELTSTDDGVEEPHISSGTLYLTQRAESANQPVGAGEYAINVDDIPTASGEPVGPNTVSVGSNFTINNSNDASGTISANLSSAALDGYTMATSLTLTADDTKQMTLTGTNIGAHIPLSITSGTVNIGTSNSASTENGLGITMSGDSVAASTGFTSITASGGSTLNLLGSDNVHVARTWAFQGGSKLNASGRLILSGGATISFSASA